MKTSKLREALEQVETFGDAFDLMSIFYESKNHSFHMSRKPEGWVCKVMKVTAIANGKETVYKESFVLKETGSSFVEAFKKGAASYLK